MKKGARSVGWTGDGRVLENEGKSITIEQKQDHPRQIEINSSKKVILAAPPTFVFPRHSLTTPMRSTRLYSPAACSLPNDNGWVIRGPEPIKGKGSMCGGEKDMKGVKVKWRRIIRVTRR